MFERKDPTDNQWDHWFARRCHNIARPNRPSDIIGQSYHVGTGIDVFHRKTKRYRSPKHEHPNNNWHWCEWFRDCQFASRNTIRRRYWMATIARRSCREDACWINPLVDLHSECFGFGLVNQLVLIFGRRNNKRSHPKSSSSQPVDIPSDTITNPLVDLHGERFGFGFGDQLVLVFGRRNNYQSHPKLGSNNIRRYGHSPRRERLCRHHYHSVHGHSVNDLWCESIGSQSVKFGVEDFIRGECQFRRRQSRNGQCIGFARYNKCDQREYIIHGHSPFPERLHRVSELVSDTISSSNRT
jgi:hypothetical protein